MVKLRDLLDLDLDLDEVVEFARAVRRLPREVKIMSTLTDNMDALVGRFQNVAAVFAADIPVLQAAVQAKVSTSMSDADVADVQNNIAKLTTMASTFEQLASGLTPPPSVTSPVTGQTSTASSTPGAASTMASGLVGSG